MQPEVCATNLLISLFLNLVMLLELTRVNFLKSFEESSKPLQVSKQFGLVFSHTAPGRGDIKPGEWV